MTEKDNRIHLDYSMLPIADPHAEIAAERKLIVLSSNPSTLKLFEAEKGREERIVNHQAAVAREREIMNQRRAEMERRQTTNSKAA